MENLKAGISKKLEIVVKPEDTAVKYGSGMIEVFASPAMIALMEKTALEAVAPFIPEGKSTVGSEVNVKHVKPTPVGGSVICEAILEEMEGKKLVFRVEAWDKEGLIGKGTHSRYIVNTEKFMAQVNK